VFVDVTRHLHDDRPGLKRRLALAPGHHFQCISYLPPRPTWIQFLIRRRTIISSSSRTQPKPTEQYQGRTAGTLGDVGCFSFYRARTWRVLRSGRDCTDNPGLQEKLRVLRDHGQVRKYTIAWWVGIAGMDGIQAASQRQTSTPGKRICSGAPRAAIYRARGD